jgi:predicted metal-dependent hydrolase
MDTPSDARAATAGRAIVSRRARLTTLSSDTPRYWFNGDAYLTHVMNAFSLTFPEGERMFIVAVRAFSEQVKDPLLLRQVHGFLAQEAQHRREHAAFNDWLRALGVDVDRYYAEVAAVLRVDQPDGQRSARLALKRRVQLAVTCALEHFTAILAELWLRRDDLRQLAHADVRPLWIWHSLEELEHKAVAFDVYLAVGGTYFARALAMIGATFVFLWKVGSIHTRLMCADRQHDPRVWLRGFWRCWGLGGYFSALFPAYLRYFKPGFHPWQHDDSWLVARFERELASLAQEGRREL